MSRLYREKLRLIQEANKRLLAEQEDIGPTCQPNPSTASFPFNAAGPKGGSYEINEPNQSFQDNMKRLLSGPQGCQGLQNKNNSLATMLQQIIIDDGPPQKFVVVMGKLAWLSSFMANNTNVSNGCANCGT